VSKSREQLNSWLSQIDIEGKIVLDVGVQDKPTSRLTKGIPAKYMTMDIDPKWNPDIVADINSSIFIKHPTCDIIFCIEVLEHCWNPIRAIKNMKKILKPGGTLYISTPFINPHHDEVDYLRYTNEWYEKVLPMLGLDIIRIEERRATTGLGALQNFYTLEGMKYSKIRAQTKGPYTYPVGYFIEAKKV
jgi:SAM-dependent methyltransferase